MNKFRLAAYAGAAALALPLCHYALSVCFSFASSEAIARVDSTGKHGAPEFFNTPGAGEGCGGIIYSNPFGKADAACAAAEAAPPAVAAHADPGQLRASLNTVAPCKGTQKMNMLSADCVAQNAGAATMVRQLEALVEQGQPQAGAELAKVIERERKANTANGEYLDELERAEAILLRIAASGGLEADRKIARPQAVPAGGPRFVNVAGR